MSQTGAVLRSFGIRYGYYNPKNWNESRYADPIVDTFGDLMDAMFKVAMAPDADKPAMLTAFGDGIACKVNKLAEMNLTHHGGKFIAGNKVTIGDFIMISYIECTLFNTNSPCMGPAQSTLS